MAEVEDYGRHQQAELVGPRAMLLCMCLFAHACVLSAQDLRYRLLAVQRARALQCVGFVKPVRYR